MEDGDCEGLLSPSPGDAGKELLRHLLKDRMSPANTPSPTPQAPLTARRQLSCDSIRSEEEDRPGSNGNMVREINVVYTEQVTKFLLFVSSKYLITTLY